MLDEIRVEVIDLDNVIQQCYIQLLEVGAHLQDQYCIVTGVWDGTGGGQAIVSMLVEAMSQIRIASEHVTTVTAANISVIQRIPEIGTK
jgi:hypothetical protein